MPRFPSSSLLRRGAERTRRVAGSFARADDAATMAEYALLVAVIALIALAGAKTLGTNLNARFSNEAARVANP